MTLPVTVAEFGTYLNNTAVATDPRAQLILDAAVVLCQVVANPLPAGAEWVVYDVAERAYANPTAVRDQSLGLYAEGEGPFAEGANGTVGGGLWLTENNKQTLRLLAGRGGAFTIDTLPSTYTPTVPIWDTGAVFGDATAGDWDAPP